MKMYEDFFVANIFRVWTSILLEQANPQLGEKVLDLACGTVSLFQ
jgi:ubiquinone/menaquinone biosynthesis C-methylase UbiE